MKFLYLLKPAIWGAVMLLPFFSYGQWQKDINTLPLGAMPMQYNSSFAGESDSPRFNTAFTYHLQSFMGGENYNYYASYDQFIPALRSGIGVTFNKGSHDYSFSPSNGDPTAKRTNIYSSSFNHLNGTLAIAPKFSIKGKYTLSPSLDFTYGKGNIDAILPEEQLKYYDPNGQHEWLESRVGLLFNTNKYYVGYSANLLNRHLHKGRSIDMNNFIFISYLQAGYTFQRSSESKFSFTPQIAYRITTTDKGLDPIDFSGLSAINLTFRYDKYLGGLSNRGILMGMQTEKIRFMAGIGNFGRSRGSYVPGFLSTGNISLRYIFKKDD